MLNTPSLVLFETGIATQMGVVPVVAPATSSALGGSERAKAVNSGAPGGFLRQHWVNAS